MRTISIPTNDRPELLQRCLDSLKNAIGIEHWTLVFSCEPNQRVCEMVTRISWCPVYFSRNPARFGCWDNTFRAVQFAMALGSQLNLYLEDDVIVSPDVLRLTEQFGASDYAGVLCLRRWDNTRQQAPEIVSPARHGLLGDGFAFRVKTWPQIQSYWFRRDGGGLMWDWAVSKGLDEAKVPQWRPMLHRSQNIGVNGTHTAHGADPNRFSPCYSGPPVQKFRFV